MVAGRGVRQIADQRERVEQPIWWRGLPLATLLAEIDSERYRGSLSSAVRLFVTDFYREQFDIQERSKMMPEAIDHPVRLH